MGGFVGGGDDDTSQIDKSNQLLQEQLDIQKKQEAQKLRALAEKEFGIVKASGSYNFNTRTPLGVTDNGSI